MAGSLLNFQFQQALLDINQENYSNFIANDVDFSDKTEVNISSHLERNAAIIDCLSLSKYFIIGLSDYMEEKSIVQLTLNRECFDVLCSLIKQVPPFCHKNTKFEGLRT